MIYGSVDILLDPVFVSVFCIKSDYIAFLLGNCVLKQALISTDHNQIPLPRDGQLLLSKSKNQKLPSTFPNISTANTSNTEAPVLHIVENTNEEGNDIECIGNY